MNYTIFRRLFNRLEGVFQDFSRTFREKILLNFLKIMKKNDFVFLCHFMTLQVFHGGPCRAAGEDRGCFAERRDMLVACGCAFAVDVRMKT